MPILADPAMVPAMSRPARAKLEISPESLLRVPLVRELLTDPHVKLVPRAVDKGWFYSGQVPVSVTGFFPPTGEVYYGARSFLAEWLGFAAQSARPYNEGDLLLPELFFAVHDSLHAWAYNAMRTLRPELELGEGAITSKNIEDFVFCHLLSETVATVGLDYWYLGQVNLNDVCDIGTCFRTLTVSYHDDFLGEYRKFNPKFEVQAPAFFAAMVEFYCSGVFKGFDLRALKQSPRVLRWLEHELRYGQTQRQYTRQWLAYLSADEIRYSPRKLAAPVSSDKSWKRELVNELGLLLWQKVKQGSSPVLKTPLARAAAWSCPEGKAPDFRFLNLNATSERPEAGDDFEFYFYQYVSRYEFKQFDEGFLRRLTVLRDEKNVKGLERAFKGKRRLAQCDGEPGNLFILN